MQVTCCAYSKFTCQCIMFCVHTALSFLQLADWGEKEMKSLIVTALVMALLLQMAWGTRPASQKMQDEITRARKVITPDKRSLDIRQIPPLPNLPNLPNVPGVPGK